MGKNIKSYAITQVHFPWGRERSLMAKRPNVQIFWLKYGTVILYTFVSKFTSKIFKQNFSITYFGKISSELSRIRSIHPQTLRITQN